MPDKPDLPKSPPPQNTVAPPKPKMPENRVIQGNDPAPDAIRAINPVLRGPQNDDD